MKKFGVVYIPKGLDTLSQDLAKTEILEKSLEKINNLNQNKLQNRYNVTISQSLLKNISKESYFFWPSHTMLNILDSKFWSYGKDSSLTFDESKIEFVPNVTLRKIHANTHSSVFKKYYFDKKDSAEKFVKMIQNMMTDALQQVFAEAKIIKSSSEYFFLDNQFPVVGVSVDISIPNDDEVMNFEQVNYMVYKNNAMYSLKFEFKLEEATKWRKNINYILRKSLFL